MTAADAVTRMKARAVPVVSLVQAGLSPAHLLAGLGRGDLLALAVILADAADPLRVKAIADAPGDEGMPPRSRMDVLRAAHREYARLCRAGLHVPYRVRLLEREYRAARQRARAGEARDAA